ncbi:vWA domain-containing protein [Streptomyces coeruleorubidus]|uniref:Substrate-binding domain-containing protein n=1 Tax=Streptomyces coeruleorubidus TaxID=116188 RepID=A0ABZ0KHI6_STRC4|nr:substrate-binding domain-containing protein [Streptomyces coeruleorubidus]WOT37234.1 substrate-binding domain-containing protein [Streptomyces coeruleorubidus]
MRRGAGLLALCLALVTTLLTACSGGDGDDPVRLRVLAGPDLAVLGPLLGELKDETGVDLRLDHRADAETNTPDSDRYDLAWLSSDRYLRLTDKNATRGWQRTPTMTSPVVIGLKPGVARKLNAQVPGSRLTWADIADAAATGTVRFGMADPRHAGSGLAALVGVATAAAGTGAALRPEDVSCDRLRGFRSGQTLTADTGPALVDSYVDHQDEANALITYESDLLALNATDRLDDRLEIVRPEDGMVLADFPLLLLNPAHRTAYDKVTQWLRRDSVQRRIMRHTLRRPVNTAVTRDPRLREPVGNALFYPDRPAVVETLLADYGDPDRRTTSQVVFLLDFSGSMRGARMAALREAFAGLSGADLSSSGKFTRFYRGERLTVVRFGGRVLEEKTVTVTGPRDLTALTGTVARGGYGDATAVWSALDHGYRTATRELAADPDRSVSLVLMTDGENNAGLSYAEFVRRHKALPAAVRDAVHTYPVHFGDADAGELRRAAARTGGRMVGAAGSSLSEAFKEIRGCH